MAKKTDCGKAIDMNKENARNRTKEILSKVRRPEGIEGLDMQCLLKCITPVAQNGKPAEEPYGIIPLSAKKDWFYLVFPEGTLQTKYTIVGNLVVGEGMVYPNGNQVVVEADGTKRTPLCFSASASRSVNEANAVAMATQAALSMALGNAGFQTPAYIAYDPEKSIIMRTDDTRLDELLDAERGTNLFGTMATGADTCTEKSGKGEMKPAPEKKEKQAAQRETATVPDALAKTAAKDEPVPESTPALEGSTSEMKIPETLKDALATVVNIPGGFRGRTMKEVVATAANANSARRRIERMTDKQYIKRQDPNFDEGEMYAAEQAAVSIILKEDLEALLANLREG